MNFYFENKKINENIFKAEFGLEKECLRVDMQGKLSHTPHCFVDEHIQRDFCENQVEFITDVFNSSDDVCKHLHELHIQAQDILYSLKTGRELLWCFSNPPYIDDENDIPIAKFVGELKNKSAYRNYLAQKYGKKKMLYSGIHLNFSFPEYFFKDTFPISGEKPYQEYKNKIYLELAQKLLNFAWLIVYLTAASPVIDGSFINHKQFGNTIVTGYTSARCSEIGYWNDFVPILRYDNLDKYTDSIQHYVDTGKLRSFSELYYPIRLKPKGFNSLENLRKNGINHIELRMIDLNPLSPIGIFKEDINFIHYLIIYLMSMPYLKLSDSVQIKTIKNEKIASLYDDSNIISYDNISGSVRDLALNVINDMIVFYQPFNIEKINNVLTYQRNKITNNQRYATKVIDKFGRQYVKNGIALAKNIQEQIIKGGS